MKTQQYNIALKALTERIVMLEVPDIADRMRAAAASEGLSLASWLRQIARRTLQDSERTGRAA